MVAGLYLRETALPAIVTFVAVGIAAAIVWLWWCWFTLYPQSCCGKPPRDCRCRRRMW